MSYYITFGAYQDRLRSYYEETGSFLLFKELILSMYNRQEYQESPAVFERPQNLENMSDEEFDLFVDTLPLCLDPILDPQIPFLVKEDDLIPFSKDVFAYRHPRYTRFRDHRHNYFELDYIVRGGAALSFEGQSRHLSEGDLCILSPHSTHEVYTEDDSIIHSIAIRVSTFNSSFFALLSRNDLLSFFFRNILQGNEQPNYLIFHVADCPSVALNIRHMMIESCREDIYCNLCCIGYLNIMFAELLRTCSESNQYSDFANSADFSMVLRYIQNHYRNVTLSELAAVFHYSEPHLSTLIRKHTGMTFTALIRELRLADALHYLLDTQMKISEIAEKVGYHSADHFSRVFSSVYHMSPLEYRKKNAFR